MLLISILDDGFPTEQMIVAVAMEECKAEAHEKAKVISEEFAAKFGRFIITFHPDGMERRN